MIRVLVLNSSRIVKSRTKLPGAEFSHELRSIDLPTLRALFDLAPDVAFFIKDANGCYVTVNQSLLARHGLREPDEVIGKRPIEICPGDLGRIPTEQDEKVLRTGEPLVHHLQLHWYPPRAPVSCLTNILSLQDTAGRTTGIIGFSRDVRTPLQTAEIPLAFAEVIAEFEEHPSMACSPSTLARKSQQSALQFARLTRRIFGLTPLQFIVKTRITAGSRLLRDTDQSVAEIAQRCGYQDQSSFTRAFRVVSGLTPLEYRRRKQLPE